MREDRDVCGKCMVQRSCILDFLSKTSITEAFLVTAANSDCMWHNEMEIPCTDCH